jgi:hypothetical protein
MVHEQAAQLAEELRLAQAGSQSMTISSSTTVGEHSVHCDNSYLAAARTELYSK